MAVGGSGPPSTKPSASRSRSGPRLQGKVRAAQGTAAHDRSAESQRRGITLDLGFSSLTFSSPPRRIVFVDCPGHADLLRTVLGGAALMDAAVLVMDARRGFQAQSVESLAVVAVCTRVLLVVLTKCDLYAREQGLSEACLASSRVWPPPELSQALEPRVQRIRAVLRRSVPGFARVAIHLTALGSLEAPLGVSSVLASLGALSPARAALRPGSASAGAASAAAAGSAVPPLLVYDHVFSVRSVGTIVSGTVLSGEIASGTELVSGSVSQDRQVKVRGLQCFHQPRARAFAGDRVALRVTGVTPDQLSQRGILGAPGELVLVSGFVATCAVVPWRSGSLTVPARIQVSIAHGTRMATVWLGVPGRTTLPLSAFSDGRVSWTLASPSSSSTDSDVLRPSDIGPGLSDRHTGAEHAVRSGARSAAQIYAQNWTRVFRTQAGLPQTLTSPEPLFPTLAMTSRRWKSVRREPHRQLRLHALIQGRGATVLAAIRELVPNQDDWARETQTFGSAVPPTTRADLDTVDPLPSDVSSGSSDGRGSNCDDVSNLVGPDPVAEEGGTFDGLVQEPLVATVRFDTPMWVPKLPLYFLGLRPAGTSPANSCRVACYGRLLHLMDCHDVELEGGSVKVPAPVVLTSVGIRVASVTRAVRGPGSAGRLALVAQSLFLPDRVPPHIDGHTVLVILAVITRNTPEDTHSPIQDDDPISIPPPDTPNPEPDPEPQPASQPGLRRRRTRRGCRGGARRRRRGPKSAQTLLAPPPSSPPLVGPSEPTRSPSPENAASGPVLPFPLPSSSLPRPYSSSSLPSSAKASVPTASGPVQRKRRRRRRRRPQATGPDERLPPQPRAAPRTWCLSVPYRTASVRCRIALAHRGTNIGTGTVALVPVTHTWLETVVVSPPAQPDSPLSIPPHALLSAALPLIPGQAVYPYLRLRAIPVPPISTPATPSSS